MIHHSMLFENALNSCDKLYHWKLLQAMPNKAEKYRQPLFPTRVLGLLQLLIMEFFGYAKLVLTTLRKLVSSQNFIKVSPSETIQNLLLVLNGVFLLTISFVQKSRKLINAVARFNLLRPLQNMLELDSFWMEVCASFKLS